MCLSKKFTHFAENCLCMHLSRTYESCLIAFNTCVPPREDLSAFCDLRILQLSLKLTAGFETEVCLALLWCLQFFVWLRREVRSDFKLV